MYEQLVFIGPIVGIASIVALCRSWVVGVVMMLLSAVLYAWFVELPGVPFGIIIYPSDVVSTVIFIAGILRTVFRFSNHAPLSFKLLAASLMISFTLGLIQYGKPAGVDFRVMFSFLAAAIFFSTFQYNSVSVAKISNIWILMACALAVIAWAVWAMDVAGMGVARRWIDSDPTGVKYRVLNSSTTYVIGVGLVMSVHRIMCMRGGTRRLWPICIALGATVLVLQHRSVWGATLISLLVLICFARSGRSRVFFYGALVALALVIALPFMASKLSGVWDSVSLQAERATQYRRGTVGGRLHAWQQVWEDWQRLGMGQQIIGKPFGSSYAGLKNVPHNCYLQVMYRTGYIGIILMLVAYGGTLIRLLLRRQIEYGDKTDPALLLCALIVGQMAFFMPYSFTAEQGLLMGVAMSFASEAFAVRRILARTSRREGALAPESKSLEAISPVRATLLS